MTISLRTKNKLRRLKILKINITSVLKNPIKNLSNSFHVLSRNRSDLSMKNARKLVSKSKNERKKKSGKEKRKSSF